MLDQINHRQSQCGFTGPGFSDNTERFAAFELKINLIYRRQLLQNFTEKAFFERKFDGYALAAENIIILLFIL